MKLIKVGLILIGTSLLIVGLLINKTTIAYSVYKVEEFNIDRKTRIFSSINNLLKHDDRIKNNFPNRDLKKIIDLLHIGEKEFSIDHKIVLAICSQESNLKKTARSKKNSNGSRDYGICQHNEEHYKKRFVKASRLLRKYNIWHNPKNKKDLSLGIISAFIYLDNKKNELKKSGIFSNKNWIASYNTGVRGLTLYPKTASEYYKKVIGFKKIIDKNISYKISQNRQ